MFIFFFSFLLLVFFIFLRVVPFFIWFSWLYIAFLYWSSSIILSSVVFCRYLEVLVKSRYCCIVYSWKPISSSPLNIFFGFLLFLIFLLNFSSFSK